MEMDRLKSAIEGILFASGEPMQISRISAVLGISKEDVEDAAVSMAEEYRLGRGIQLIRLENSLQLCSAPEWSEDIRRALETRNPPKLTQTALEVLAVVAYFQPVTRTYIERIRGVDSSYTVGVLQERGLIESCGKLDVPGRPTLFKTTDEFLRVFGLESLKELPEIPDMEPSEGQMEIQLAIDAIKEQAEDTSPEV